MTPAPQWEESARRDLEELALRVSLTALKRYALEPEMRIASARPLLINAVYLYAASTSEADAARVFHQAMSDVADARKRGRQ